jgi:hypothetical protein
MDGQKVLLLNEDATPCVVVLVISTGVDERHRGDCDTGSWLRLLGADMRFGFLQCPGAEGAEGAEKEEFA